MERAFKVSWNELKTNGPLKDLYVNKFIRFSSMKDAFKLASELKREQAKNINIERIN